MTLKPCGHVTCSRQLRYAGCKTVSIKNNPLNHARILCCLKSSKLKFEEFEFDAWTEEEALTYSKQSIILVAGYSEAVSED